MQVMGLRQNQRRKLHYRWVSLFQIHKLKAFSPWCWIQPCWSQSQNCHPLLSLSQCLNISQASYPRWIGRCVILSECHLFCHSLLKLNRTVAVIVFEAIIHVTRSSIPSFFSSRFCWRQDSQRLSWTRMRCRGDSLHSHWNHMFIWTLKSHQHCQKRSFSLHYCFFLIVPTPTQQDRNSR